MNRNTNSRKRERRDVTKAGYWNFNSSFDPNWGNNSGGFTEGIERLNKIFGGPLLEWPSKGHVDPELAEALNSLWQRGLRQLADPALENYYDALFSTVDEGGIAEVTKLPYPMQVCLSYVVWSNAEDGRRNQRELDMHTQYQGGIQRDSTVTQLREKIAELESSEVPQ